MEGLFFILFEVLTLFFLTKSRFCTYIRANRFTASPLHRFTASPLHRFTASPLHRFTASPLHRLWRGFCLFLYSPKLTIYYVRPQTCDERRIRGNARH
jgi:Fe-S-cluster containining protein